MRGPVQPGVTGRIRGDGDAVLLVASHPQGRRYGSVVVSHASRVLSMAAGGLLAGCTEETPVSQPLVHPNHNRPPAGERGTTFEPRLEARQIAWHPDSTEVSRIQVLARQLIRAR